MRLLACLIVAPQRGYDEPAILSYAISSFCPTSADGLQFEPLYRQMENGGYAAMLYDLLKLDLANWHPREVVRTKALAEQQERSLSALDEWWLEVLQTGVLVGASTKDPGRPVSNRYEETTFEQDQFSGFSHRRTVRRDGLYDHARASSPRLRSASDAALGRYLRE